VNHDWRSVPLAGRLRIEASAGTGKTWTIAMLYLRLLLQEGRTPAQVLVGTFSEAAAQELRERIRQRLREALLVLDGRHDDALLFAWLASLDSTAAQQRLRLQLALLELDAAPIGTLHGLCRRILAEHPLATRSAVRGLELVDQQLLHATLCDDLWRRLAHDPAPLDAADRQLLAAGRQALHKALAGLVEGAPPLRLPSAAQIADCAVLEQTHHAEALHQLAGRSELFSRSNAALRGELSLLGALLEDPAPDYQRVRSKLKYLAAGDPADPGLRGQFKPGAADDVLALPAMRFALRAGAALQHAARTLKAVGLARCRAAYLAQREAWQQRNGMLCFADLISRVHAAVTDADGALADALYARWPAALVDEFQDTDGQQYGIVDRLYRDHDGAPRGALLMVGDPKQAIYRFRGGEIHTYRRAAAAATARLDLATNHRSSRALVAALNAFYAAAGDGFAIPGDASDPAWFGYHPVLASDRRDATPCRENDDVVVAPLQIHLLPAGATPKQLDPRREAALDACAERIAAVLAGGQHRIGSRPLAAGDIAVLLPTNRHIRALRERLRRRGVPCTGSGRSNVFSTRWAGALQLLLWAWQHPTDTGALRAALMSPLFARPFAEVAALRQQPARWHAWLERFAADARRWREGGVLAALAAVFDCETPRLLADAEAGERALTDLRHLGELLAGAEAEGRHGDGLVAWLARQRREADSEQAEERQLRVESDAARVQLLTLHASKGLEYPWVMLPLLWDQAGRDEEFPAVHDTQQGVKAIDLGSPDWAAARSEAALEDQRERLRLVYVALTRAIHRCDVWALDPRRPAGGRSAAPLDDPARSALDRLLDAIHPRWSAPPPPLSGIAWSSGWAHGDTRLDASASAGLAALPAPPVLQHTLDSLVSFSSLTHGPRSEPQRAQDEPAELADADDAAADTPPHPELLAWESLRGTTVGNALHALLERRDSTRRFAAQRSLVETTLAEFGLDEVGLPARVIRRLDAVLDCELAPGLRLGTLPAAAQRVEMDFRLPLPNLSLDALRAACLRHGDPTLWPAHVTPRRLQGLLNGKIDLVFAFDDRLHVLDYKSNRLGLGVADYAAAPLARAMDRSAYRFQALLYTVAVHRYLRQRRHDYAPQRHLGEAWYLFLRGLGLAPGAGLWRQQFPLALIEAVDDVLAGEVAA
jgi:exodeoxyribonuclease V beta subunit